MSSSSSKSRRECRSATSSSGETGVEIGTAGPARIRSSLQLLGEVKLNQDRSVFVTPRLTGLVESVLADTGDQVRRGQVLAVMTSQALADQHQ